jgi:hypothetical protein
MIKIITSTRRSYKMKKVLSLTIFFAFVFVGMTVTSGLYAKEKSPDTNKEKESKTGCAQPCPSAKAGTATHACTAECADTLCSTKMDPKKDEFQSWILSSQHEYVFAKALIDYRLINGSFPKGVAELINSGLLVVWPADPRTGKPMKLVPSLKPVESDLGKIAYVRKSDTEASFQIVVKVDGKYSIYELPCCQTLDAYFGETAEKIKDNKCLIRGSFEEAMKGAFSAAITRSDYLKGKNSPKTVADIANRNFFLIKENLKPDFVSDNIDKALFFEVGIATLDGELVKFGRATTCMNDCTGKEKIDKFSWITSVADTEKEWVDDSNAYGKLRNVQYFYSTKLAKNGGADYPPQMIISKQDILGK